MKDNFLQGSVILKTNKEMDLIREYMDATFIPTELLYRGSKDGW
jgi:hypothetical protein